MARSFNSSARRGVVSLLGIEAGELPASGTSWRQLGHVKPTKGRELTSPALSWALAKRSEFDEAEWKVSLGLKWREITGTELKNAELKKKGTELKNAELAVALQTKLEFSTAEWDKFNIKRLTTGHFVKVGDNYFQPAEAFGISSLAMDHYIKADSEIDGYEGAYYSPAECMLAGDFWYNSRAVEKRGWPTFEVGAAMVVVSHLERAQRQGQLRGTHYTEAQKTPKLLNSAHQTPGRSNVLPAALTHIFQRTFPVQTHHFSAS